MAFDFKKLTEQANDLVDKMKTYLGKAEKVAEDLEDKKENKVETDSSADNNKKDDDDNTPRSAP